MEEVNSKAHIHVYLISGFLGAGKTTLLQRFLNHYSYRRIAVLKNEVGEVSVDATMIQKLGIQVVEINNGSIFCTCRHDAFIDAMKQIATYPIDMLFIEGSGIADPANFGKDLTLLLDLVGPIYHHLGNVCLVDASSFLELIDEMPAIENQVRFSNIILLNKTDLVDESMISKIIIKIQSINSTAKIIPTQYAALDLSTIESIIGPVCFAGNVAGTNTERNKPKTVVLPTISSKTFLDPKVLHPFFQQILPDTLRIKGFFRGPESWMYIDGVQSQFQINTVNIEPLVKEIVVIFRPDIDLGLLDTLQTQWRTQILGKEK